MNALTRGLAALAVTLSFSPQLLAQAPPVVNNVRVLVNDGDTFVLDLETRGILDPALGPYRITSVAVGSAAGGTVTLISGPIQGSSVDFAGGAGGDKCVGM